MIEIVLAIGIVVIIIGVIGVLFIGTYFYIIFTVGLVIIFLVTILYTLIPVKITKKEVPSVDIIQIETPYGY